MLTVCKDHNVSDKMNNECWNMYTQKNLIFPYNKHYDTNNIQYNELISYTSSTVKIKNTSK